MSLIVLPISAGAMVFSREIVTLLFLRGAFTEQDVEATAQVLFFYSLGLLAFSIKDVMLNVFYALQDTKNSHGQLGAGAGDQYCTQYPSSQTAGC